MPFHGFKRAVVLGQAVQFQKRHRSSQWHPRFGGTNQKLEANLKIVNKRQLSVR